jgi:GT2 family glycosyltransferase
MNDVKSAREGSASEGVVRELDADAHVVVAIPTYNNETTVGETLDMLFTQERPPDQVVVCDASTDGTRRVIRERAIMEPEIDIDVIDQPREGVADAYDAILSYVAGKYDLFVTLQADLLVDDDWLAGHLRLHREHHKIDIVTGDHTDRSPTNREVGSHERPYYVGRNFSAKRGVLERIDGWDPNFLRGEDWDMRIRLAGAGIRSYACTAVSYRWLRQDSYITLSKAKRRPTAVTFLAKFGPWYAWFHPSHIVSDLLSLGAVVLGAVTLLTLPVSPVFALVSSGLFAATLLVYGVAHVLLRGGVDGDIFCGPPRKQLLTGISVLYALRRVLDSGPVWNMAGFDPQNVPRYKF